MIPAHFDYVQAQSVEEAIKKLAESNGEGTILAGGHSLLPLLKFRITEPGLIIDISRIPNLKQITKTDDMLTVGALTTHYEISKNEHIAQSLPALKKAASVIGDLQIRNRGTIGGNIAHADPVADYPAVAHALNATLQVHNSEGETEIAIDELVMGPLITTLSDDSLITAINFELPPEDAKQVYLKFFHPATAYPVIGVAAFASLDDEGKVNYLRVGITGVSDVAYRAEAVESQLIGQEPSSELIQSASEQASEDGDMGEDLFASEEYREHLAQVYVKRALEKVLL